MKSPKKPNRAARSLRRGEQPSFPSRTPKSRPKREVSFPTVPASALDQWSSVAQWYDQIIGDDGGEFHQKVIFPGLQRLLRPLSASRDKNWSCRVLDLACGQGATSRFLASLGYRMVGVDIAKPLIDAARTREQADRLDITYLVGDAMNLAVGFSPLNDLSFDAVIMVLAIQNIAQLSPVWEACHRLLKPNHPIFLVMMHPCFRVPQHSDWMWDSGKKQQSRTVHSYLSSQSIDIVTHPGKLASGKQSAATTHYHRPLQAYFNTLGSAGLLVERVEEWVSHKKSEPGSKQQEMDRSRKEIPMFLALKARRVDC